MSAPRPSEADVEAWGPLSADERSAIYAQITERAEAFLVQCGACDAGLPMSCVCNDGDPRPVIADLLNMFAARDAEHEREVAALRETAVRIAYEHAATVDGEFGCAHDEEALRAGGRLPAFEGDEFQPLPDDCDGKRVVDCHLRALLPRDDAAGGA